MSSNKTFSGWAEIFGDPVAVAALVDRLVHHAEVLVLRGDSYRLKGKGKELHGRSSAVRAGYVKVMRADEGEGDRPEVRYWESAAQQQALLCAALEDLRAAGLKGPQVTVLSTRNDTACVAAALTEQPWRDLLTPLAHSGPHGPVFDLHSGKTRFTTVHRFKGLESRAVVLTDIEHLSTPRDRDLFYIGATRATQHLVVLAHESLRGTLQ